MKTPLDIEALISASGVPSVDLVRSVHNLLKNGTRQQFETLRFSLSESFLNAGVKDDIVTDCAEWAREQWESGRMEPGPASFSAVGGMMLTAFQLGLLVGVAMRAGVE